jgi:hypothetical protein
MTYGTPGQSKSYWHKIPAILARKARDVFSFWDKLRYVQAKIFTNLKSPPTHKINVCVDGSDSRKK